MGWFDTAWNNITSIDVGAALKSAGSAVASGVSTAAKWTVDTAAPAVGKAIAWTAQAAVSPIVEGATRVVGAEPPKWAVDRNREMAGAITTAAKATADFSVYAWNNPGRASALVGQGLVNGVTSTVGFVVDVVKSPVVAVANLGLEGDKKWGYFNVSSIMNEAGQIKNWVPETWQSEGFKKAFARIDPESPNAGYERVLLYGGQALFEIPMFVVTTGLTGGAAAGVYAARGAALGVKTAQAARAIHVADTAIKVERAVAAVDKAADAVKVLKAANTVEKTAEVVETGAKAVKAADAAGDAAKVVDGAADAAKAVEATTNAATPAMEASRKAAEARSTLKTLKEAGNTDAAAIREAERLVKEAERAATAAQKAERAAPRMTLAEVHEGRMAKIAGNVSDKLDEAQRAIKALDKSGKVALESHGELKTIGEASDAITNTRKAFEALKESGQASAKELAAVEKLIAKAESIRGPVEPKWLGIIRPHDEAPRFLTRTMTGADDWDNLGYLGRIGENSRIGYYRTARFLDARYDGTLGRVAEFSGAGLSFGVGVHSDIKNGKETIAKGQGDINASTQGAVKTTDQYNAATGSDADIEREATGGAGGEVKGEFNGSSGAATPPSDSTQQSDGYDAGKNTNSFNLRSQGLVIPGGLSEVQPTPPETVMPPPASAPRTGAGVPQGQ